MGDQEENNAAVSSRWRRFLPLVLLSALVVVMFLQYSISQEHADLAQKPDSERLEELLLSQESTVDTVYLSFPSPGPTAGFLPWVYPEDGATISLTQFWRGWYLDLMDPYTREINESIGVNSAICVKLDASFLVENADDDLGWDDYFQRSVLLVNGTPWTHTGPELIFNELGLSTGLRVIDVETGETIFEEKRSNAVGPFLVCWSVPLSSGAHDVTFRVVTTAGRTFSYSWSFEINWR
jgi:hypothetical protein